MKPNFLYLTLMTLFRPKHFALWALMCGSFYTLSSQETKDSLRLWNLLNHNDMNTEKTIDQSEIPSNTGTFFKTNPNDKTEQILVITGEFISRLNYNTLGDVLKDLPQFYVNQPGSALQGEVFYSAGLNGNENYAILINGVPVHTYFSAGFPVANNLPIRQAQRIEISFNPASARYGSGATLGVINIITPQTERPVYIKASLNGFSNNFNNMSLLVGGKFGKGRNTVRFDVYGNYQKYANIKLKSDTQISSLYNYRYKYYPYFNNTNYKQLPPDNGPVEHLSDLTGLNVYYRNWYLMFNSANRKDQASNGLNPLAMYKDVANFFVSDRQLNFAITNEKTKKNRHNFYQGRVSYYRIQSGSAAKYIFPALKQAAFDYLIENLKGTVPKDSIPFIVNRNLQKLDAHLFDQVRFVRGGALDINLTVLREFSIKNLQIKYGFNYTIAGGTAINRYSRTPYYDNIFSSDTNTITSNIGRNNAYFTGMGSIVLGISYKFKKYNFDFFNSLQSGNILTTGNNKSVNMPSLRITRKRGKDKSAWFLVYSMGMDAFNPTRKENQYKFTRVTQDSLAIERDFSTYSYTKKTQISFGTQRNYLFYSKTTGIPVIGFYDENYNYSRVATVNTRYYGNYISPNSILEHYGITMVSPDLNTNSFTSGIYSGNDTSHQYGWKLGVKTIALFSVQKYTLPNADGVQKTNYFTPSNKIRFNFYLSNGRNWMFTFLYNLQNKVRPSFYYDAVLPNKQTIDLLFNYNFTRQFSANIKLFNITGTNLFGPQATGSVDDLNLQPQRYLRMLITMNYALE